MLHQAIIEHKTPTRYVVHAYRSSSWWYDMRANDLLHMQLANMSFDKKSSISQLSFVFKNKLMAAVAERFYVLKFQHGGEKTW